MTTIADQVFSEIESLEADRGWCVVDVHDICCKRNPDLDSDWEAERTTYTFDDGSQLTDCGDFGCWVVQS